MNKPNLGIHIEGYFTAHQVDWIADMVSKSDRVGIAIDKIYKYEGKVHIDTHPIVLENANEND